MKDLSLYIHIPFCKQKCNYCDFLSFPNTDEYHKAYIDALKKEMEYSSKTIKDSTINTIFIGGGTPTILSSDLLEELLCYIPNIYNISTEAEITIESNPGTLDNEKISLLNDSIVNRVSIGVQTIDNQLLRYLGRIHDYDSFLNNYHELRKYPFIINLDLMLGLPSQKPEDFMKTLREIVKLNPEHISCYSLIIEEGTKFYQDNLKGRLELPNEDVERDMYHSCVDYLNKKGYIHYEISNFAKEGYECKHNIVYWKCRDYIGLGLGAHSYHNNQRYNNSTSLKEYIKNANDSIFTKYEVYHVNKKAAMEEFMFLGLRLLEGIKKSEFKKRFGIDIRDVYDKQIYELSLQKLIIEDDKVIKLTKKGLDLSNTVFSQFLLD